MKSQYTVIVMRLCARLLIQPRPFMARLSLDPNHAPCTELSCRPDLTMSAAGCGERLSEKVALRLPTLTPGPILLRCRARPPLYLAEESKTPLVELQSSSCVCSPNPYLQVLSFVQSMDDQCPVCKSDRYLNPKLRLLVSSCYHKMYLNSYHAWVSTDSYITIQV
jgi:hypothetical protein